VPGPVGFEKLGNVRNKWIVRVGVRQKRTDTQQDFANRQCRTPLVLENVQTDSSVGVDVAVIDTGRKVNLWRLREEETRGIGDRRQYGTG